MKPWFLALGLTFTLLQLRSAECRVACLNGGWADGDYQAEPSPTCRCMDFKSYDVMAHQQRLLAPKKPSRGSRLSPPPDPVRPSWTYD